MRLFGGFTSPPAPTQQKTAKKDKINVTTEQHNTAITNMTNKLIDRSLESLPTNVTQDVLKSVTMKTLDSWLLQISNTGEGPINIRGMKRTEKENKLLAVSNYNNQNSIQEEGSLPSVDNVVDNSEEEGEEKTEDLIAQVFDHVRKKLKTDDIARDQIKVAVEVSPISNTIVMSLLTSTVVLNKLAQQFLSNVGLTYSYETFV